MRKNLFFNLLPKIVILIFLFINVQQSNSLTIKSGQIISSDGKIYEFASPKEKEFLIKKSKTHGNSMGVFNNNLFLIIDEKILFIPLQEIISSTDIQITNLVNDKTNSFAAKYNLIENKNFIKNRLNLAAIKLKRLHLLNKLQKKFFRKNGSYITFYFNF
tara:strand:- start:131 stop:610 length:480 start_codon:yes stop_codon:yes gene_type:complete